MSRRALRRLKGKQRGQEPLGPGALQFVLREDVDTEELRREPADCCPRDAGKEDVRVNNRFELINPEEPEEDCGDKVEGDASADSASAGNQGQARSRNTEAKTNGKDGNRAAAPEQPVSSGKPRNKKKKRPKSKRNVAPAAAVVVAAAAAEAKGNGQKDTDHTQEGAEEDNSGQAQASPPTHGSRKNSMHVEHRHLNPDTELKRYFGARAIQGEQRSRQRPRAYIKSMWLTNPKSNWPRFSKPGLSMRLLETRKGRSLFAFEHNEEYQQVQHRFLAAVESMEPNNIVVLLQTSPYHVDSLLQLSDACRLQDDQEMARDLVERALYSMECAFHPMFSLTNGSARLDYRRPENRSFFLALYKQMIFLEKRGCPRTALEYCKLILSLEPNEDPLCMLLMVDHLALRARSYEDLTCLYMDWEVHRNLSQLPNFAYSVPLAYFLLSQQTNRSSYELTIAKEKASFLIRQALIMFPAVLLPLLEHCGVRPDAAVANHPFFGPNAQISQSPAMTQLVTLYLKRSYSLWKEPAIMSWLEKNVHEVVRAVDAKDPIVRTYESRRRVLYQRAPRNIHRHVILSEIKEAIATLPPEVTAEAVMNFDPLPPEDSIHSYVRPERQTPVGQTNTVALFFRSLLPNYTTEEDRLQEQRLDGRGGGRGSTAEGLDRVQGLNRLMVAMREMMANFQFNDLDITHPENQQNPQGQGQAEGQGEGDEDGEWD